MEKNLFIFSVGYLNPKSGELMIGGVQTYIHSLSLLGKQNGFKVTIFQLESKLEVNFIYDDANVIIRNIRAAKMQRYFEKMYKQLNTSNSIFIIATDQMNIKSMANNVITIQHGITFDIPGYNINGFWNKTKLLQHINKLLRCLKNVMRCYQSSNTVCVDYNFYNWFRTIGSIYPNKRIKVIPNYSNSYITEDELNYKLSNRSIKKRILFARRFCDYRGTILFSNVINRLLKQYSNIEITFAGSGPLENYITQNFIDYDCVNISKFNTNDSISYHKQYDIAVVPTIFSEGTSLSLLEAMSAGCFPLATHVGGITNIILDNFNGILCSPDEESLYNSFVRILKMNDQEFNAIVKNAYYSAVKAFSYDNWRHKWCSFIDEILLEAN